MSYTLDDGRVLTETEMLKVHQAFVRQSRIEYIKENVSLPDAEIEKIADEITRQMDKYGYTEEEALGIILNS